MAVVRSRPAVPPYRRCSMTCSDSGATASLALAAAASRSTSSRCAGLSAPDDTPGSARSLNAAEAGRVGEPGFVFGSGVVFIVSRARLTVPLVVAGPLERHKAVADIP